MPVLNHNLSSPDLGAPDLGTPDLAIYVHWPFCRSKCPYCDFNSHVREEIDEAAWARALCQELDHYRTLSGPRRITSVFFGGGTPSLMSARTTGSVLERIAHNWSLHEDVEITLEANPTSVEANKFHDFSAAGVNRVSLGIQALNDQDLKALGREHDVAEAVAAINTAQKYFKRSSFDLIYARMGQSLPAWEKELTQALAMAVGHLSLYQLTIERGTAFYQAYNKGRLTLPDETLSSDMYESTQAICNAHGLPSYEVSNHARPREESRHNLAYWRYADYIGVGPGAHGRLGFDDDLHGLCQIRSPEKWLEKVQRLGHATDQDILISQHEMAEEMIMMGLRLKNGISRADFASRIGADMDDFMDPAALKRLCELGYMEKDDHLLKASPQGMLVLNSLLRQLLLHPS